MTTTEQIVIAIFGSSMAAAIITATVGHLQQRRTARSKALGALSLTAATWLESPEVFMRARAEAYAAALEARADRIRVEQFMTRATLLSHAAQRAKKNGTPPPADLVEANRLEREMYAQLEAMRAALWHPWRSAFARRVLRQELAFAPPQQREPEPDAASALSERRASRS